jgi:hypothetical protein
VSRSFRHVAGADPCLDPSHKGIRWLSPAPVLLSTTT